MVLTHSLNSFIVTKRISDWHHFCKWKFLLSISVLNFRWQFLLELYKWLFLRQLCRFWGSIAIISVVLYAKVMLVDLFVAITQVTVSVAIMWLEVSAANMWMTICWLEMMLVGISVAIMQVVFSAVHYAHDYFYCDSAGDCFCCSYVCDSFKYQLCIPFTNWYLFFIKLNRKHQKEEVIISNLHFTTLINILSKSRYFVGRIYIQIGWKSHSVLLFSR